MTANDATGGGNRRNEGGLLWLLRAGAALCFAGYAWQYLYWDGPYGVLLWNPAVYDLLAGWGVEWDQFVGDGASPGVVRRVGVMIGWVHAALAVVSLTANRRSRGQLAALLGGAGLVCLTAYCRYVQALRVPAMFIEHGGQILMPVLLVLALRFGVRGRAVEWTAVAAVVTTFAGHGAYAVGWVPQPGQFLGMIRIVLGVGEETAWAILTAVGVTDLLVCVAVLVPRLRRPAALYAAVWGCLTALARPLAGMKTSLVWWGADLFVHEAAYRIPHAAIPLLLFVLWRPSACRDPAPDLPGTRTGQAADRGAAAAPAPVLPHGAGP